MTEQSGAVWGVWKADPNVYKEGIISGLIGAVGIAVWFLIVDTLHGRPFYTPSALGTTLFALLRGGTGDTGAPVSFAMVLVFSIIHGGGFVAIGVFGASLLGRGDDREGHAFWGAFLLVTFAVWFTFLNMLFAGVVLNAVSIPDIFIAHLIASVLMGFYYRRRHPGLSS